MQETIEYDEGQLKQWNRVVVEVFTSWDKISEYVSDQTGVNMLQKEDMQKIAHVIIGRWLFPKDGIRSTSTSELKNIYAPAQIIAGLLGDFEASLDRKAYDKVLRITKVLIEYDLIVRKSIKKETHYEPTERLLVYCIDCSTRLMEVTGAE